MTIEASWPTWAGVAKDIFNEKIDNIAGEVAIGGVLPQPAIKLPAFALQFRMKNPEETQPELRRVFQSFIGFLNVTGAQNGQPQLDLGMETDGDVQLIMASYVPDRDKRESVNEKIQYNFSPTMAFAGERIIVSSSASLARALIDPASGNMLEKGHSKEAAEGEIGLLLELLGFFRDVRLNLDVTESQMALGMALDVKSDAETQQ